VSWSDPDGQLAGWAVGAIVGGLYGGISAAVTADTFSWKAVTLGAAAGAFSGGVVGGLIDPSTSGLTGGTMTLARYMGLKVAAGGFGGFAGSAVGQLAVDGQVDLSKAVGAGVAGMAGGLLSSILAPGGPGIPASFADSEALFPVLANAVGGMAVWAGELAGGGFRANGMRPWSDTGGQGDWLVAGGCKP